MIWCLHGAVGMAADWKPFASAMTAAGHAVRRVDLWRYLDCCPMEMEEFGRAFCEEVMSAGAESNILVGYSMGGRLALQALLESTRAGEQLFRAAVIVSAHPGLPTDEERLMRMAADAEWAGRALVGEWGDFLERWEGRMRSASLGVEPETGWGDRRLLQPRRQAVARSFMDWSLGKQGDLREELPELNCPVLWVTGVRDEKFTSLGREAVRLLRRGRMEIVPETGHRVPWERPDAFAELMRGFLARES
jgi:2-succinyl-6-hydroxy-2,4-cyclohexadiene-1-carboxylate synthase